MLCTVPSLPPPSPVFPSMIMDMPVMLIIQEIDPSRGVYCFRVYRCFLYCLFSSIALSRNNCAFPAGNSLGFFCLLENTSFIYYRFITSFPAGLPTDEEAVYLSLYAMHSKTFIFNYPGYFFFPCYCYLAFFLFFQDRFYPLTLSLVPVFINVYSLR